jgi:hypothetical protein
VGGFDWQVDSRADPLLAPGPVARQPPGVQPQISYPIIGPSFFITPKLMMNASAYDLEDDPVTKDQFDPKSLHRAVPTFSLDSGLVFERETKLFGRAVTQTLEPRLFYVYTPYRDQTKFPNFDTAEATFNFSQIFNENRFVGSDRISDANQLTAAVVSRFLEPSGAERLRLAFGQRFYFNDQRVQLDPTVKRSEPFRLPAGRQRPHFRILGLGQRGAVQSEATAASSARTSMCSSSRGRKKCSMPATAICATASRMPISRPSGRCRRSGSAWAGSVTR